jgi:hypothetical protein
MRFAEWMLVIRYLDQRSPTVAARGARQATAGPEVEDSASAANLQVDAGAVTELKGMVAGSCLCGSQRGFLRHR